MDSSQPPPPDPAGFPQPEPAVRAAAFTAVNRLEQELVASMPGLSVPVRAWMRSLAMGSEPAEYFLHPQAYPLLQIPSWLLDKSGAGAHDRFRGDLVRAAVSGYYYLRLIDNVMDGDETVERDILPAANFFQVQSQLPFRDHFPHGHVFWDDYHHWWFQFAEATWKDAATTEVDREMFERVIALKTCPEKILVAAAAYYSDRPEWIDPWMTFSEAFGCWHQMRDDLRDWIADHRYGRTTYLLSEAHRRMSAGETVPGWMLRTGFEWAVDTLDGWMQAARTSAAALESGKVENYLERLAAATDRSHAQIRSGFAELAQWERFFDK